MDLASALTQLLQQYPQLSKYLILVGAAYLALTVVLNVVLLALKTFGLQDSKFGWFVSKLLELVGNLHGLFEAKQQAEMKGPAVKLLLLFALGFTLFAAAPARAQDSGSVGGLDWSVGPTLAMFEFDFHGGGPTSVASGAGLQLSITHDALKRAFFGKSWDLVDLIVMGFGSMVNANGAQFGQLSLAGGIAVLSSLLSFSVGHPLAGPGGTFGLFSLNFNFGLAPSVPPAGLASGPAGMLRGNTLYFGAL